MNDDQTIFALSSAKGKGGVAIIRVSGKYALKSVKIISGRDDFKPRYATYCSLIHPVSRETIDQAVVTYFQNPHSFTGEDTVEYGVHGSQAIIDDLINALSSQADHRMAEPGEFTKRAFENGKLDLTEAEAVADLIDAETQVQKNQALSQLSGALSDIYFGWAEMLKSTLAHCEADLEFPDEDLPDELEKTFKPRVLLLRDEIHAHLDDNRRGERLRDGLKIAIIGAPNAGKSSLINALAQRDIAIISDVAGTTRDVLDVHLDVGGYPVIITDTAGIRDMHDDAKAHDALENEGIKRAIDRAEQADFKVLMFDCTDDVLDLQIMNLKHDHDICVLNKCDLNGSLVLEDSIRISAQQGEGISDLLALILKRVELLFGRSEGVSLTRARHRSALENVVDALDRALFCDNEELFAEDLRLAMRELGRITGRVVSEDILDVIFGDFCIGK